MFEYNVNYLALFWIGTASQCHRCHSLLFTGLQESLCTEYELCSIDTLEMNEFFKWTPVFKDDILWSLNRIDYTRTKYPEGQ